MKIHPGDALAVFVLLAVPLSITGYAIAVVVRALL